MSTNKANVHVLLDSIAARDATAIRELVTDNVTWWAPVSSARLGLARPLVGVGAVVTLLSGAHSFFRADTTTWTVLALIEEGSTVVAHVQRRCLTTSGLTYENDYLLRFDFVDGRIATAWEHTDTAYALELLGANTVDG